MSLAAQIALVAIGGAIGSVARYLASLCFGASPLVTLGVNVTGSFLIGGLLATRLSDPAVLFLAVGVLGGFTTFSAFEWQILSAVRSGAIAPALLYAAGSVVLGFAAVWAGFALSSRAN